MSHFHRKRGHLEMGSILVYCFSDRHLLISPLMSNFSMSKYGVIKWRNSPLLSGFNVMERCFIEAGKSRDASHGSIPLHFRLFNWPTGGILPKSPLLSETRHMSTRASTFFCIGLLPCFYLSYLPYGRRLASGGYGQLYFFYFFIYLANHIRMKFLMQ